MSSTANRFNAEITGNPKAEQIKFARSVPLAHEEC